jgi:hypothetical protein
MPDSAPIVHPLSSDSGAAALLEQLTAATSSATGATSGVHVLVHVSEAGNTGYARVEQTPYSGGTLQRWIRHARRGSSEGGWSEQHHPRAQQQLGPWKDASADALDRMLIDRCKQAWRLEGDAPYVAEFPAATFDACGIEAPPVA